MLDWRAYHRLVSGKRIVWIVPAFGLIGSQAGHLLAYELRFGNAAQQVQSAGAHSYFPSLAKTGLGVAALTLLVALLIVGAGRVATGRRIKPEAAPSFVPLVAALYTIQLACFAAQETIEALIGGGSVSVSTLLLLGTLGQLPVAVVATVAVRWLGARLLPALAAIALGAGGVYRQHGYIVALGAWPLAPRTARVHDTISAGFNRRGPPSF